MHNKRQQHLRIKFSVILKTVFSLFLVQILASGYLFAQDDLRVISGESSNNNWLLFGDASNSLYHHLAGEAYGLLDKRSESITHLNTLPDWKQKQDEVREVLTDIIGPFPEKNPLNAQIKRTIEKDFYTVEHIVYESQPEFYVTSSLFVPDEVEGQAPAILYLSGHTENGYRSGTYQHKILNLVKKGFIVFAIDPVGQGERREYYDPESGSSVVGASTREHSYTGAQAFITGGSQALYMIWDGIRAVDYLLTRDEVDPARLGVTGRSGGGTQTAYIAAMDERIYAAAPEAYITNFNYLLKSIGPQDLEQNLYHGIMQGIDHADFLTVRAPKPALIISTTEDFFSIQGGRETAKEVSGIYEAYDKADNFGMVEDGGGHGSTKKNREAMYAFFQEHLDNPGYPEDEEVEILSDEEIQVTNTGQVSTSLGGETIFSLNRQEAEQRNTELLASRDDVDRHFPKVLKAARELSGYREPAEVKRPVFTGRIQRDGYVIEKYFVKGEGDYVVPYLLMVPDEANNKALVYLHPSGKAAEASEGGEIELFVRNGFTVLAPDMVGIGEMGAGDVGNYSTQIKDFDPTSFDVWTASVLIGRSITGLHAGDIVRLNQLLKRDHGADEVFGVARERMAPALLHAAAFDSSITQIALLEPYSSYFSIVTNRYYDPGFHLSTVAGSVGAYDLPDLAASLAPRRLMMAGVTDGAGKMMGQESITDELSLISDTYHDKNANNQLSITTREALDNLNDLLLDWID
ncbi:MAG: alpha/beta hydrolase family protein [Balneolales bacterium]